MSNFVVESTDGVGVGVGNRELRPRSSWTTTVETVQNYMHFKSSPPCRQQRTESVLSVCHVCAMPLLDTARDRASSLSNEHLALHADASAQCSTALQTLGGYAGNT